MLKYPQVSHLKSHLGFWMRLVSNQVSHSFAKKLADSDVTVAEWVILREMYSADQITSPSRIVEITQLTKGAVSKLLTRLLEKKLILRNESFQDGRAQEVQLSARAIKLIPRLAHLADENDAEFFSSLSPVEKKQLIRILKKIASHQKLNQLPIN